MYYSEEFLKNKLTASEIKDFSKILEVYKIKKQNYILDLMLESKIKTNFFERYELIVSDKKISKSQTKKYEIIFGEEKGKQYANKLNREKSNRCVEFWIKKGHTLEEAKQIIFERSSTNSIEGVMKRKNISEEEARKIIQERSEQGKRTLLSNFTEEELIEINKSKSTSLESLIKKYGGEEGTKRFNERIEKYKTSSSLEGHIEKYGKEEGTKIWKQKAAKNSFSKSLEGYIERLGKEEGTKRWEEINAKKTFSKTLEGHIEKYGKEEGTKIWKQRTEKRLQTINSKPLEEINEINKKKAFTLENQIRIYGKIKGTKRYFEILERNKANKTFFSKESFEIFSKIKKVKNFKYKFGLEEYFLKHSKGVYFYDLTVLDSKNNIVCIVEFHGTKFHIKEDWSNANELIWITPEESFAKDKAKRELLISNGIPFLEIFSDEENISTKIEEFIEKQIKQKGNE